jgi:hypothetical protein
MNNVAISPSIAMYALQNQNVERKIVKNIEIKNKIVNDTIDDRETTNISDINITEPTNISDTNLNETTNISDINLNETTNISDINVTELDVNLGTNMPDFATL